MAAKKRRMFGVREKIILYILLSSIIPLLFSIILMFTISRSSVLHIAENTMVNSIQGIKRFCEVQSDELDAKLIAQIDRSFVIAKNTIHEYAAPAILTSSTNITVTNQDTQEKSDISLPDFAAGTTKFFKNYGIVDRIADKIDIPGTTSTIFQMHDGKLIRIATNVKTSRGDRAILTYIPSDSLVYRTIAEGKAYRGRAVVVGKWNITHYEPLKSRDGKIIGALYVGVPAPKTAIFDMINQARIGKSGYVFVMNSEGQLIIHPKLSGKNIRNLKDARSGKLFIRDVIARKEGRVVFNTAENGSPVKKIAYYTYFPKWDWIIASTVDYNDILHSLNTMLYVLLALLFGFIGILIFSSRYLASRISEPFKKIVDAAVRVSKGDLNAFIIQSQYVKCVEVKNCTQESCPAFHSRNKACWRLDGTLCDDGKPMDRTQKQNACRHCEVYQRSIRNEIDELIEVVNNMIVTIRQIMGSIKKATLELNKNAEDLADVSKKVEIESQNQAASIEQTTSAHEELIATIESVAQSADAQADKVSMTTAAMEELSSTTHTVGQNSQYVDAIGKETVQKARDTEAMLQKTIGSINQISDRSKQIGDIVGIINDVSDQINLLALNASIEAARAGDYGRGFAVVAEEISKLADATANSTKEIEVLIKSVKTDIDSGAPLVNQTAQVITSMIQNIEEAARLMGEIARSTGNQINSSDLVKNEVEEINKMSGQIARATGEQKITSEEILKAVSRINESIQEIAASSQVIAESARSVREKSTQLKQITELFTV